MKAAKKAAVAFEAEKIKDGRLDESARGTAAKREEAAGATGAAPFYFPTNTKQAEDIKKLTEQLSTIEAQLNKQDEASQKKKQEMLK